MFENYHIKPEAKAYFIKAYNAQMSGKYEHAVFLYKKSLTLHNTAEGHTFLGWAYSFMGKYEDAIVECKKAVELDPSFGNPYNDIGSYLIQVGKVDKAIPWLKRAKTAERYETPEFAYCNLGKAYEHKGLWPWALKEYEAALEFNPDYQPAKLALLDLQSKLN